MMRVKKFIIPCLLSMVYCLWSIGCGSINDTTGEDYGDLMASPSGLTLTEAEHLDGWGKSECDLCHNLYNIHLTDSDSGIDMAAVRATVEAGGISTCATCHGNNGVE